MSPALFYLGLTHDASPLNVREHTKPTLDQQRAMLDRMASMADGRMVLSTCERFEVYATTSCPHAGRWLAALADWFHLPRRIVSRYARVRRGGEAASHLLRVAAGLESRVVGEPQVLGQVRAAYGRALDARALDPLLAALGRAAIRAGRRARHETRINHSRNSIATVAVDEFVADCADRRPPSVVVVGSGRMAADVLHEVRSRGVRMATIVARNSGRATQLGERFGAAILPLSELARAVGLADVAVVCTSASSYLVDAAVVGRRPERFLRLIDLSVPRNVDPTVDHLANVRLTHLDALLAARTDVPGGVLPAMRIVNEELSNFLGWCKEREATPLITALVRRARAGGRELTLAERRTLHTRIMRIKKDARTLEGAAA